MGVIKTQITFQIKELHITTNFDFLSLENLIKEGNNKIMADLTKLIADIAAERTVVDGAITLIRNIPDLIRQANTTDQAAVDKLASDIESQAHDLADAVVVGTGEVNPQTVQKDPAGPTA